MSCGERILPVVDPIFDKGYIPICLVTSDLYTPYCFVTLYSLLQNALHHCDVIIFGENLSKNNQEQLVRLNKGYYHSVRICEVGNIFNDKNSFVDNHNSKETYFRLILPYILKNYQYFLYFDSDILVLQDVFELAKINMNGNPIAAVKELFWNEKFNKANLMYAKNRLKLYSPRDYFNAGVLKFNVQAYLQEISFERIHKFVKTCKFRFLDQDILNFVFQGKITEIPPIWNVMDITSLGKDITVLSNEIKQQYLQNYHTARVLHYAGHMKPWHCDKTKFPLWWRYAQSTSIYQYICEQKRQYNDPFSASNFNDCKAYKYNYLKYIWFKILKILTFGKTNLEINQKIITLKKPINNARRFKKINEKILKK